MIKFNFARAAIASAVLGSALVSTPLLAQQKPISGGTSGGVEGRDVSAGTSGYGSTDGQSISTGGTADAEARNGGTVNTNVDTRTNDRRGSTRATADARDEDERARSRTRTVTRQGEVVRSSTMSKYKERGQPPVRDVVRTSTTPKGTRTNTNGSSD